MSDAGEVAAVQVADVLYVIPSGDACNGEVPAAPGIRKLVESAAITLTTGAAFNVLEVLVNTPAGNRTNPF
jgi:hypothetical protein